MAFDPIAWIEQWQARRNQPQQQPPVAENPLAVPSTLSPHRRRLSADEMPLSPGMRTPNRLSPHRRLTADEVPAASTPMDVPQPPEQSPLIDFSGGFPRIGQYPSVDFSGGYPQFSMQGVAPPQSSPQRAMPQAAATVATNALPAAPQESEHGGVYPWQVASPAAPPTPPAAATPLGPATVTNGPLTHPMSGMTGGRPTGVDVPNPAGFTPVESGLPSFMSVPDRTREQRADDASLNFTNDYVAIPGTTYTSNQFGGGMTESPSRIMPTGNAARRQADRGMLAEIQAGRERTGAEDRRATAGLASEEGRQRLAAVTELMKAGYSEQEANRVAGGKRGPMDVGRGDDLQSLFRTRAFTPYGIGEGPMRTLDPTRVGAALTDFVSSLPESALTGPRLAETMRFMREKFPTAQLEEWFAAAGDANSPQARLRTAAERTMPGSTVGFRPGWARPLSEALGTGIGSMLYGQ